MDKALLDGHGYLAVLGNKFHLIPTCFTIVLETNGCKMLE